MIFEEMSFKGFNMQYKEFFFGELRGIQVEEYFENFIVMGKFLLCM